MRSTPDSTRRVLEGGGKLVGILQTADICKVARIVGGHRIDQGICGQDVDDTVQPTQKMLRDRQVSSKGILRGREGLLLDNAFSREDRHRGKHPQRDDDKQEINTEQLAAQLSTGEVDHCSHRRRLFFI